MKMDPSSSSKDINPLVDLHQKKKQQRQQRQQQQHFIYTNAAAAIHPGQYDHPSSQDALPSLSHLMHNSVPNASSSLPLQPSLPLNMDDPPLELSMPPNVGVSKNSKVSFTNMDSSPIPAQMKQPDYIYQPDDTMYVNNGSTSTSSSSMTPVIDGFHSNQQKVNHQILLNPSSRSGTNPRSHHHHHHHALNPSTANNTSATTASLPPPPPPPPPQSAKNNMMNPVISDNPLTFYQRSAVDVYQQDPVHNNNNNNNNNPTSTQVFYSHSNPNASMQQVAPPPPLPPQPPAAVVAAHGSLPQTEDQHKIYSFIPLDVISQQKRPRKKYNEVERLYQCTYLNCTKAYGTLNHLNAHVTMQGHGPKRLPIEFKELRRQLKKNRQKQQAPKSRKGSSQKNEQQKQSREQPEDYQRYSLGTAMPLERDEKGEGGFHHTNVGGPQPNDFTAEVIMESNPLIAHHPTFYQQNTMPLPPLQQQPQPQQHHHHQHQQHHHQLQQQKQQQQTFPPSPSSASYRQQFQHFGMMQPQATHTAPLPLPAPTQPSSVIHQPRF